MTPTAFSVLIDWSNDGSYAGADDDVTADVQSFNYRVGATQPLTLVYDNPIAQIVLINRDNRYLVTGMRAGSAALPVVYGGIIGRRLRIMYADTPVFTGVIRAAEYYRQPGVAGSASRIMLTARGFKDLLASTPARLDSQTATGDVIIKALLALVDLPEEAGGGWRLGVPGFSELGAATYLGGNYNAIETFTQTLTDYAPAAGASVWDAISEIVQAEQGRLWIDGSGRVVAKNRDAFTFDLGGAPDWTIDETAGDNWSADYSIRLDGDAVANVINVTGAPRTTGVSELLWEYDGLPVVIPAGGSVVIRAMLRKQSGQFATASALTPSATFSAGSGVAAVTTAGGQPEVTVTSTSGATLTALTLTGAPEVAQNVFTVTATNAGSVTEFGERIANVSIGPSGDYASALSVAQNEARRRAYPAPMLGAITLVAGDGSAAAADLLSYRINDLFSVTLDNLDAQRLLMTGVEAGLSAARTWTGTVHFENPNAAPVWRLGIAGSSELGVNTYLGPAAVYNRITDADGNYILDIDGNYLVE